jgi:hypothetical protein
MPWHLERRESQWCVIKDSDGSSAGCHDSRADAIKQQRALSANESRVASMYAELDESYEEVVGEVIEEKEVSHKSSELVKIEVGDQALTASLMERMDAMSQREALTTEALVAALHAIGTREPVVNVEAAPAPNVTVEAAPPAEVKVDVHVPEQAAPQVHLSPEIHLPESAPVTKTVTFERDPLTGQVSKAEVNEG